MLHDQSHVQCPSSVLSWSLQSQEPSLVVAAVYHRSASPAPKFPHLLHTNWWSLAPNTVPMKCYRSQVTSIPNYINGQSTSTEPMTHTIMGVFSTVYMRILSSLVCLWLQLPGLWLGQLQRTCVITSHIHPVHAHIAAVIMCDKQFSRDLRYKDRKRQQTMHLFLWLLNYCMGK